MEDCELCGSRIDAAYGISVDGVELRVCSSCAKGKRIVYREGDRAAKSGKAQAAARQKRAEEIEIVDNYGVKIRKAREALRLPLKVVAEMINEKESLLARVEKEETLPNEALTKKLEKALNIKLEERAEITEERRSSGRKDSATLGEFIN